MQLVVQPRVNRGRSKYNPRQMYWALGFEWQRQAGGWGW